jgi:serine/threonine-protein kinase SRPK3
MQPTGNTNNTEMNDHTNTNNTEMNDYNNTNNSEEKEIEIIDSTPVNRPSLTALERLQQKYTHHKRRRTTHHQTHQTHQNNTDHSTSSEESDSGGSVSEDSDGTYQESSTDYKKGGYHNVKIGDCYNERYIMEKKLGFGYFSTVWLASDKTVETNHPHKLVAIKISKSRESFQEAAQDEMKILGEIGSHPFCVQLLDQFIVWGSNGKHYCLVFEMMWKDLYYLIRKFNYRGIPNKLLKVICYQVLCGVEYMHEKRIIHTDIKPENFLLTLPYDLNYETVFQDRQHYLELAKQINIQKSLLAQTHVSTGTVLSKNQRKRLKEKIAKLQQNNISCVDPEKLATMETQLKALTKLKPPSELNKAKNLIIKVADFGNACWTYKHYSSDITTRQYRSPEVLLGYVYGTGVDIFSCGTMFFELATGEFLFQPRKGENNHDVNIRNENHLVLMHRTMGPIPRYMIKDGKYSENYFTRKCEFLNHSRSSLEPRPLIDLLQRYEYKGTDMALFADFLGHLVELDPKKRWTAAQAKTHPWLLEVHNNFLQNGSRAFSLE